MNVTAKGIVESVKDTIVGLIKGSGDIFNTIIDTVSGMVSNLAKDTGKTGGGINRVAAGNYWCNDSRYR